MRGRRGGLLAALILLFSAIPVSPAHACTCAARGDPRERLAAADPRLDFIRNQMGMFSMLPLTPEQVLVLRDRHAIYMADSGRFNVLGMADDAVDRFVAAVAEVVGG